MRSRGRPATVIFGPPSQYAAAAFLYRGAADLAPWRTMPISVVVATVRRLVPVDLRGGPSSTGGTGAGTSRRAGMQWVAFDGPRHGFRFPT
eukprot:4719664-Lingulodinium_polyedra.AAC.1